MKHLYHVGVFLLLLLLLPKLYAQAQISRLHPDGPAYGLGPAADFTRQLQLSAARGGSAATVALRVSAAQTFAIQINQRGSLAGTSSYIGGQVQGVHHSSFLVSIDGAKVQGQLLLPDTKQAYRYSTDANQHVVVEAVDINSLICVGYKPGGTAARTVQPAPNPALRSTATPLLQSYPGAKGCILLDFDGQVVTSPCWTVKNNGNPITAAPSGYSDADVEATWKIVSEDFRPFSLNITTDEAVYSTYPNNMRQRCIITPTSTAGPGYGGIAQYGTFTTEATAGDDTPCWAFQYGGTGLVGIANSASHEVGHTLGLHHDGTKNPLREYYTLNTIWTPIMGASNSNLSQWSKGEYVSASNTEDDLAMIASPSNGVGYRPDDYGNNIATAAPLTVTGTGWSGQGIIEQRSDQDYFSFTTSGGPVSFNVAAGFVQGDLDIVARLFSSSGNLLGSYNTPGLGNLAVSFAATLSAGTYYLQIDGVGSGGNIANQLATEYTDYASLGAYTISAVAGAGVAAGPPDTSIHASLYSNCNSNNGTSTPLPVGKFTLAGIRARGTTTNPNGPSFDNNYCNLTADVGYEVVLFHGDNFTGDSVLLPSNGSNGRVVYPGWNTGETSSVVVRRAISVGLYRNCSNVFACVGLRPGNYTTADLQARGMTDNDLSSLAVPNGFQVMLYEGDNFTGASLTLASNTDCLTDNALGTDNWDNKTSSVRVQATSTTLYSGCGQSGTALGLVAGSYKLADLQAKGFLDNDLSGLAISPGYEVVAYDGDNFTGASLTVQSNTDCLTSATLGTGTWDNKASSIRVQPSSLLASPVAPVRAILYQGCSFGGTTVSLPVGNYVQADLQALGMPTKDLSALLVSSGYEVVLYDADNFTGASITVTADNDCLESIAWSDRAYWNDRAVSLRVRATTTVLTSITVTPTGTTTSVGSTLQFTAQAKDQAGMPYTPASTTPVWSVSGGGTISNTGLFTASTAGGPFTVTAAGGTIKGTAPVTVSEYPPLINFRISIYNHSAALGDSLEFTAAAQDSARYAYIIPNSKVTWSVSGGGTINSRGVFKATSAGGPFTVTGVYSGFTDKIIDIKVNPPAGATLAVTPATASVNTGATQQFTAQGKDQAGTPFAATPTWSVSGGGSISSTGLFTAGPTAGGPFTVTATVGSLTGTTTYSVVTPVAGGPNLALRKPVRASSIESGGTPVTNAVDGNGGTRWSSAFADPQWIYVDLGASYAINRVKLVWENAYGKDYVVEIAPDTVNWTPLKTVTGNTVLTNDLTGLTGTGRFVRMRGVTRASNYGYSLYELEVYGTSGTAPTPVLTSLAVTPATASVAAGATRQFTAQGRDQAGNPIAKPGLTWTVAGGGGTISNMGLLTAGSTSGSFTVTASSGGITGTASFTVQAGPPATGANLALGKPARASSVENAGTAAANAVDGQGVNGTRWSSAFTDAEWLYVDLGATYNVNRVKLMWEAALGKNFAVEISLDTVQWVPLQTVTNNTSLVNDLTNVAGTGRYVRMRGITRGSIYGYSLWELEVYGTAGPAARTAAATSPAATRATLLPPLAVFPNPAKQTITLTNLEAQPTAVAIYNPAGFLVKQLTIEQATKTTQIDVSALKTGMYIIRVTSLGHTQSQRFTKE